MVDRTLNYGRHLISSFLNRSLPYNTVLDLGAGQGDDLMIAHKINPIAKLNCIECYDSYAKKLESNGINVFRLNIEKDILPFKSETIDVVIMNQILEHTKEVFWIFHEVSRILKRGGKLIIGVPNLASFHNRLLLFFGKQPTSLKNYSAHVRGFTKKDLLCLINEPFFNGYSIRDFGGGNFYPFGPIIARPLAKLFPTFAWSIFFLLEKTRFYEGEYLQYPIQCSLETNFYLGDAS